jgi:predicted amidophosphoribosyltransferase
MRDRHVAHLCRSCHGPLARQESVCWRCGAERESEPILHAAAATVLQEGAVSSAAVPVTG